MGCRFGIISELMLHVYEGCRLVVGVRWTIGRMIVLM